jgi:hypothetical protein
MICGNRRKPVSGRWIIVATPRKTVASQHLENSDIPDSVQRNSTLFPGVSFRETRKIGQS